MTTLKPISTDLLRLETMAESDFYNPYTKFQWPDSVPLDQPWMSEDLVTLSGTEHWTALSRDQQLAVTRCEAVNFYSLNANGIRNLLGEIVLRIHTRAYADVSAYLHHFIDEENKHMWFFSKFCLLYGNKLYPAMPHFGASALEDVCEAAGELAMFGRILIFEEMGDFFNVHIAKDEAVPHISREINRVHHQDESRHVACGRQIFTQLLQQVKDEQPQDIPVLARYLEGYLEHTIGSLYNPAVYRDAGLAKPAELRRLLLEHPHRKSEHDRILARTRKFFDRSGVGALEALV